MNFVLLLFQMKIPKDIIKFKLNAIYQLKNKNNKRVYHTMMLKPVLKTNCVEVKKNVTLHLHKDVTNP